MTLIFVGLVAVCESVSVNAAALSIGRANVDGTDVIPTFINAAAGNVAVDGTSIYWTDATPNVPESSTALLVLGGLAGLVAARRRSGVSA